MERNKAKTDQKSARPRQGIAGGRKSATQAELWRRRIEVYRQWSGGLTKTEIGAKYNISFQTVGEDLKAMVAADNPIDAKNKIDAGYKEIIRRALDLAEKSKDDFKAAALLRVAMDSLSHAAKLHGFERDVNQFSFSQTQILNTGGKNPYDSLDEKDLEKEFNRRRLFLNGKDPAK